MNRYTHIINKILANRKSRRAGSNVYYDIVDGVMADALQLRRSMVMIEKHAAELGDIASEVDKATDAGSDGLMGTFKNEMGRELDFIEREIPLMRQKLDAMEKYLPRVRKAVGTI